MMIDEVFPEAFDEKCRKMSSTSKTFNHRYSLKGGAVFDGI
jgi:hypothetical protein